MENIYLVRSNFEFEVEAENEKEALELVKRKVTEHGSKYVEVIKANDIPIEAEIINEEIKSER